MTALDTTGLPFGGLGLSLDACEEHAEALQVRVTARSSAPFYGGMALHEPPVALSGYRLLTVLGCEIRGR